MVLFHLSNSPPMSKSNQKTKQVWNCIPPDRGCQLMPQREHDRRDQGWFLCDEMGLGKTAQLVTVIKRNKTDLPRGGSQINRDSWKWDTNSLRTQCVCVWWNQTNKRRIRIPASWRNCLPWLQSSDRRCPTCPQDRMGTRHPRRSTWDLKPTIQVLSQRCKSGPMPQMCCDGNPCVQWCLGFRFTPCFHRHWWCVQKKKPLELSAKSSSSTSTKNKDSIPECHFENVELEMYPEEKKLMPMRIQAQEIYPWNDETSEGMVI